MMLFSRFIGKEEELPINKLPPEILGIIFSKLEYKDAQKLKNSSTSLLNAYKSERRMIDGPDCDAHVYYKNKELRLVITIWRKIRWTRTIPLNQWKSYFQNAKCGTFDMTVDEEIPLEILKNILCCKSIRVFDCFGKSMNQMTIDLIAKYQPKSFKFIENDWSSQMLEFTKYSIVTVECSKNVDDVFEAMKFTYNLIISLKPESYEKNEHSLIKLKYNIDDKYKPHFVFNFARDTKEQQVELIENFLENSVSNIYGAGVKWQLINGYNDVHLLYMRVPNV
ncbi:unnamed protein product [Caenorhabditis angaria]|uniref:F-box domain-containing protein n=1 Tax=Caenorhabditis angaria TaxID=860376 RepID=A0A9P1N1Y6_9PELO|nr:unnamed protein product [Caenorhabditis angaria]